MKRCKNLLQDSHIINFLNINILLFLSFIFYRFYLGLKVYEFITLIISFYLSLFIFSQFKFSDNNIINLLQKIVIYTFIFIFNFLLMFIIGRYFNLIPTAICTPESFIANSVLEKGELLFNGDSPLETILTSLLSLNVLILFTNILFLYFIFSRYIFKHNITFI